MESRIKSGFFSSSAVFILAAAGSAVGLGNIWKFPYMAGVNGGGAFVLFYLLCIALIGIPVMLAEIYIGHKGRQGPIDSFHEVAKSEGQEKSKFAWQGYVFTLTSILILSFYGVVGGWSIYYTYEAIMGTFVQITPDESGAIFGGLLANPLKQILFQVLFMLLVVYVITKGVNKGIEKTITVSMPVFFVLLLILSIYAMVVGAPKEAFSFMFSPDFSKLNAHSMAEALGHAFFTLSLGLGAMLVYGAYMPKKEKNITKVVLIIALVDTVVALFAGLMIFSLVFANGGEAGGGPGLLFITLPTIFGSIYGGYIISIVWFALIAVAAWSSGISMLEVTVSHLENKGISRKKTSWGLGVFITLLGFGSVASFAGWETKFLLGKNFFDTLDFLTSSISLPIGGLIICIVVGWTVSDKLFKEYLSTISDTTFKIMRFVIKFIAPVLIIFLLGYLISKV